MGEKFPLIARRQQTLLLSVLNRHGFYAESSFGTHSVLWSRYVLGVSTYCELTGTRRQYYKTRQSLLFSNIQNFTTSAFTLLVLRRYLRRPCYCNDLHDIKKLKYPLRNEISINVFCKQFFVHNVVYFYYYYYLVIDVGKLIKFKISFFKKRFYGNNFNRLLNRSLLLPITVIIIQTQFVQFD